MAKTNASPSTDSLIQSDSATILTPTSSASNSLPSPRLPFSRSSTVRPPNSQPCSSDERADGDKGVVRLNGPSSWDAWIASIERLAREENVWDKIAPISWIFGYEVNRWKNDSKYENGNDEDDLDDVEDDEKNIKYYYPPYPDHFNLMDRPQHVFNSDVNSDAWFAADFDPNDWSRYWNLQKYFVTNTAIYDKEQKVLNKIYEHVINTIHERYLSYLKGDFYTLCQTLSILMVRVAPSIRIRRCKALHAYRKALHMITTIEPFGSNNNIAVGASENTKITASAFTKSIEDDGAGVKIGEATTTATSISKLEDWHETYQCCLYTCKKLKVPEVEGEQGLRELLQIVSTIIPDLAAEYIREIGSRKQDGKPLPKLRIVARRFYERLLEGLIC